MRVMTVLAIALWAGTGWAQGIVVQQWPMNSWQYQAWVAEQRQNQRRREVEQYWRDMNDIGDPIDFARRATELRLLKQQERYYRGLNQERESTPKWKQILDGNY